MMALAYSWAGIIGFCIIMYVILDGFTLGTGIVMPFLKKDERDIAMSVILPTWDGNQTWLVLGMASLYGAFPLAFSTLLPILYIPLILMVIGLLFRGVVFEFRLKAKNLKRWDMMFFVASLFVTFIQGTILGNMIEGFDHQHQWISFFSLLTAVFLIIGYVMLGVTRLILKTEGELQSYMRFVARCFGVALFLVLVMVSVASLEAHPMVARLWLTKENWPLLSFFPVFTIFLFVLMFTLIKTKCDWGPYWCMVFIFLCCYAGFVLDVFPYMVPYKITIIEAASPASTLSFIIVGAIVMLPVLLVYTGYSYRIFRGKVNEIIHY